MSVLAVSCQRRPIRRSVGIGRVVDMLPVTPEDIERVRSFFSFFSCDEAKKLTNSIQMRLGLWVLLTLIFGVTLFFILRVPSDHHIDAGSIPSAMPQTDSISQESSLGNGIEGEDPAIPEGEHRLPREEIEAVLKKHTGSAARESALALLAVSYAERDVETIKQFILELPPGDISHSALITVLAKLPKEQFRSMASWLAAKEDFMGYRGVDAALSRISDRWVRDDPVGAITYLSDRQAVPISQSLAKNIVGIAFDFAKGLTDGELIQIAKSSSDPGIRMVLMSRKAYINAHLRSSTDVTAMVEELLVAEEPLQKMRLVTLSGMVADGKQYTPEILTAMSKSDFPDQENRIASAVHRWMRRDVNAALEWVSANASGPLSDRIIARSWKTIANADRDAALEWVQSMEDETQKSQVLESIGEFLEQRN